MWKYIISESLLCVLAMTVLTFSGCPPSQYDSLSAFDKGAIKTIAEASKDGTLKWEEQDFKAGSSKVFYAFLKDKTYLEMHVSNTGELEQIWHRIPTGKDSYESDVMWGLFPPKYKRMIEKSLRQRIIDQNSKRLEDFRKNIIPTESEKPDTRPSLPPPPPPPPSS